jgi:hypothetical protein
MSEFLLGSSSGIGERHPRHEGRMHKFLVKIRRGAKWTWHTGRIDESPDQSGAMDCGCLSEARVVSKELLYDAEKRIDSTEVEIVAK